MKKVYGGFILFVALLIMLIACGRGGGGSSSGDNTAPVAGAGPDQNVTTGSAVTLDGSGSSDANGNALAYRWSFTSKPGGSTAELSGSTTFNPTFAPDVTGTYVVQLIVNDGTADSAPDMVVIAAAYSHLPRTGQATSYAAGDDGALQKGVAWPGTRFSANADATVTDNLTGLVWALDGNLVPARDSGWDADGTANDGAVTWQHALDYVAKLNAENYLGHGDWRLPNVNELESLFHAGFKNETVCGGACATNAAWLNSRGFTNAQEANYWSSTTRAFGTNTTTAWSVDMISGWITTDYNKSYTYHVWPVRDGSIFSTISLPRTGQTTSYAAGDDGDLQKGVAWPGTRFGANADATVTDNLTGLVWAPDGNMMPTRDSGWDTDYWDNDGLVYWQRALDYVAKLNAENYLGHSDWRLPNRKELRSLINFGQSNNATWLNSQGFTNAQEGASDPFYWSSTTYADNPDFAWNVDLHSDGYTDPGKKTVFGRYVWPVCGGI